MTDRDVIQPDTKRGYLERYYDGALDVRGIPNRESLEQGQVDRLARALAITIGTAMIPRRLGAEATYQELALDKKRARRVAHAIRSALSGWTKRMPELPGGDEIRRLSAQMNWETFVADLVTTVETELRRCASWSIRNEQTRWGKSAVVKLENERNWLTYALRD